MLLFIVLTFQQTKLTELSSINKYSSGCILYLMKKKFSVSLDRFLSISSNFHTFYIYKIELNVWLFHRTVKLWSRRPDSTLRDGSPGYPGYPPSVLMNIALR